MKRACGKDLICAAKFFKVDLIRRLIDSGVDVDSRNSLGQTALLVTQQSGCEGYDGTDAVILHMLLRAGANPYLPDSDLRTPISIISCNNSGVAGLYESYRIALFPPTTAITAITANHSITADHKQKYFVLSKSIAGGTEYNIAIDTVGTTGVVTAGA